MKELPKVYFERLLESSPDIVVAVERSGKIIFYNAGAKNSLGYSDKEVLGKSVETFYASAGEAKRVMAAMRAADEAGAGLVKNFETEFKNKSGEIVPVAISGSIIYDERGRMQGSIGFAKDISELRRHEQQVTMAELAIGLAHEINTPLEIAVNQAALLERYLKQKATEEDYPIEHDRVAAINRALRRIQVIVERVGEIAELGQYQTTEYLPGRTMTDLGLGEQPAEEATHYAAGSIAGSSVLVIDDDADACSSVADLLDSEGCDVVTAGSGLEALACLEKRGVDLVVSDVVMPDMDGYDLVSEIKHRYPDLPVVLMTAYYYDKDHVIKRSKANGLRDVIFKKPIDPDRLIQLIAARVGP